jgi:tripartite-type tricarboxylate transporter receptor subunit TctC
MDVLDNGARRLLLATVLALCLPVAVNAQTANYPDRPIKIVVGFAAGGGTDVAARIVAQKLSEGLGQSVVVENRPGASGLIGADAVAKSAPDGYTLMMGTQTTLAVAPILYPKNAIDPARDFVGIGLSGISPLVLTVNPSLPVKSVSELIALARQKPGTINFGSGGIGTTPHMAGELFAYTAGIKMVHVAYRGEAPALNDLIGGQLQVMFPNLSACIGNVRAGTLRALAVTSKAHSVSAPDIPTIAESGIPDFEAATWFGLVAPAGTPRDILVKLNGIVKRMGSEAGVQKRFVELGMMTSSSSPEELDAYIKSETAKWAKVIKDAGIKPQE